jgi:NitT/TauT family transport system ATP-binding protein
MSAGPQLALHRRFRIDLPRPRDIGEVSNEPRFHRLHKEIWDVLRDEVRKTYGLADKGSGMMKIRALLIALQVLVAVTVA